MMLREDWIGELPAAIRGEISDRMAPHHVAAGETFRHAGDVGGGMYQVESGYLKLHGLHPDGNRVLILIYRPGNSFGESPLVARRPHNHTTVALVDTCVNILGESDFWDLYARHREIPDALCRKFANAMTRQFITRETRATHRLRGLIVMTFRKLAEECGEAAGDGSITIPLPLSQTDFAEYLEVTRQAAQREIGALKAAGLIDQHRDFWTIRRPELLDSQLAA